MIRGDLAGESSPIWAKRAYPHKTARSRTAVGNLANLSRIVVGLALVQSAVLHGVDSTMARSPAALAQARRRTTALFRQASSKSEARSCGVAELASRMPSTGLWRLDKRPLSLAHGV